MTYNAPPINRRRLRIAREPTIPPDDPMPKPPDEEPPPIPGEPVTEPLANPAKPALRALIMDRRASRYGFGTADRPPPSYLQMQPHQ